MISELSYVRVPDSLSQLLSINAPENRATYAKIGQVLFGSKFNQILLEKGMGISKSFELERKLAQNGWQTFRNQMTAIYLEFYETHKYSLKPDLSYVQDLLTFEDRFEDFCHPGSNRLFLLGIYLKLNDSNLQLSGKMDGNYLIDPPATLDTMLKQGISRQPHCDYLILMTWFFLEIWGQEEFSKRLTVNQGRLMGLHASLDEKEKANFVKMILAYTSSIGQDEVFFYEKV